MLPFPYTRDEWEEEMVEALNKARQERDDTIAQCELANAEWNSWRSQALDALDRARLAEGKLLDAPTRDEVDKLIQELRKVREEQMQEYIEYAELSEWLLRWVNVTGSGTLKERVEHLVNYYATQVGRWVKKTRPNSRCTRPGYIRRRNISRK